jgi:hypothetical protein
MIKHGNKFVRPVKPNYEQMINVWVDDTKRIDIVKRLMLVDHTFKLEKLRTNPVYVETYNSILVERKKETTALDKSYLWSRKFTKKKFNLFLGYVIIWGTILSYIFFRQIQRNILYFHVKLGYDAENLKELGFWNLDFDNKDIYPERVIKEYFEVKKQKEYVKREEEKAMNYSDMFVQNISRGFINDYYKRRKNLGFNDDE